MRDDAERLVEFDVWIASRSAALTRFAYLLTGSEPAAERALSSALGVACATWSRVRRSDDPEAQVERLVVAAHLSPGGRPRRRQRPAPAVPTEGPGPAPDADDATLAWSVCATLPPAQRAAVVLRCCAEMTYPQIAAVLGGKEALAREEVEGAFTALRVAAGGGRSDDDVEGAFRAALAEHAEDPSDTGDRATAAHAAARDRSRRRIVPAAAVGVLLAAAVVGGVATYDGGGSPAAVTSPGDHPRGWRAESYHGVQLWVPSSWGWGHGPAVDDRQPVSCGLGAYSPTSINTTVIYRLRGAGVLPYVGRPSQPDVVCAVPHATGSHVWFDSPLPPGSGPAATTVRAHGTSDFTITVADRNRAERATILRSIEPVVVDAHGCPRNSGGIARVEATAGAEPSPRSVRTLSLCVYATAAADQQMLFYSTNIDAAEARLATQQIEAPVLGTDAVCLVTPDRTHVLLIARTSSAPGVFSVDPGHCPEDPTGYVSGSGLHVLTEASLRLWAVDGLSLYAGASDVGTAPPTRAPLP